jgi:hypothetical protein
LFKSKEAWGKEISLEEQLLLDMDVLHCILYTPAATHLNSFIINKKGNRSHPIPFFVVMSIPLVCVIIIHVTCHFVKASKQEFV